MMELMTIKKAIKKAFSVRELLIESQKRTAKTAKNVNY